MINRGEVRIPFDASVWSHELSTAQALAKAGYIVEFLPVSNRNQAKSPDIFMNGLKWEIKSPRTNKLSAVERNLKRATKQSGNIVVDSRRISKLHDKTIMPLLLKKCQQQKTIKQLIYINKQGQVIDIKGIAR